jgi:hypothetical protein
LTRRRDAALANANIFLDHLSLSTAAAISPFANVDVDVDLFFSSYS